MKIRFHNIDHLTQFVFWLDVMTGTEIFSVTMFAVAVIWYLAMRLSFRRITTFVRI